MKGDFSRDSFDRLRHYSRVLQQQGRVELDADGNERQAIQLHHLRSLAADVIGTQGGPGTGFQILPNFEGEPPLPPLQKNFVISKGHYYVDGWLCENDDDVLFAGSSDHAAQPWWRPDKALVPGRYLAYLDVWERHVSAVEVDGPAERTSPTALREVALGGPDTTTRTQVVWQVKVSQEEGAFKLPVEVNKGDWIKSKWMDTEWGKWRAQWQPVEQGRLKAKATDTTGADASEPCVVSPQSRYRGLENQLYRIEIHRGGSTGEEQPPTFVWSRENGSVVFAVERIDDGSVKLVDGWRDTRFGLAIGDVVELLDEDTALSGAAGSLLRVTDVDLDALKISFEGGLAGSKVNSSRHSVLRRWDHGRRKGDIDTRKANNEGRPNIANDLALVITEGRWLTIEDGISVWFDPAAVGGPAQQYRSGDYWLIPARTAIGDVLWPRSTEAQPQALLMEPHGVEHHYAPLAIVTVAASGDVSVFDEPARRFKSLIELSDLIPPAL